ncbi:MAG TPA: molybdenum cofactor guanylyltransferase [Dehalococcoidia bacterium]|nr:molybdenum cofactor guanylyltransferase [Dehalococcoidia bacterium]
MSAAVILAGGKSARLGRDKAGEVLLGRSLLQRAVDAFAGLVDEYVIVSAVGQALPAVEVDAPLLTAEDVYPETGPLGGIYTGLRAMQAPHAVVVACDMPLLQPALIAELLRLAPAHDLVVPIKGILPEPLCAAYSKAFIDAAKRRLDAGEYKITDVFEAVQPLYLRPDDWRPFDPEGLSFQNVNREEDLRRVLALLKAEEGS